MVYAEVVMKKDCIQDYIDWWQSYDKMYTSNRNRVNWMVRFQEASYHKITITVSNSWIPIHEWCEQIIGRNNYAWTGNTFWFETEEDAVAFKLRWV